MFDLEVEVTDFSQLVNDLLGYVTYLRHAFAPYAASVLASAISCCFKTYLNFAALRSHVRFLERDQQASRITCLSREIINRLLSGFEHTRAGHEVISQSV